MNALPTSKPAISATMSASMKPTTRPIIPIRPHCTARAASAEPEVQALPGLEPHVAVAAMLPIGKPVRLFLKICSNPRNLSTL